MMHKKSKILIFIILPLAMYGWTSSPPTGFAVSSIDSTYKITITPVSLPSNFLYKIAQEGDYASVFKEAPSLDPKNLVAWGKLEKFKGPEREMIWTRPLDLKFSPLRVYLHELGYVLMVGDWPGGTTSDSLCFLLYGPRGDILKKKTLGDTFSSGQLNYLAKCATPIWWKNIQPTILSKSYPSIDPFTGKPLQSVPAISITLAECLNGFGDDVIEIQIPLVGPEAGEALFIRHKEI